jgi:hypothetical protein
LKVPRRPLVRAHVQTEAAAGMVKRASQLFYQVAPISSNLILSPVAQVIRGA